MQDFGKEMAGLCFARSSCRVFPEKRRLDSFVNAWPYPLPYQTYKTYNLVTLRTSEWRCHKLGCHSNMKHHDININGSYWVQYPISDQCKNTSNSFKFHQVANGTVAVSSVASAAVTATVITVGWHAAVWPQQWDKGGTRWVLPCFGWKRVEKWLYCLYNLRYWVDGLTTYDIRPPTTGRSEAH